MKDLDIVPECFIDTNLVETLLHLKQVDTDGVNHQKGCNTVVRVMTTSKALKDSFALGIVDADKRPLSYVKNECNEIARSRHIVLLKHARSLFPANHSGYGPVDIGLRERCRSGHGRLWIAVRLEGFHGSQQASAVEE